MKSFLTILFSLCFCPIICCQQLTFQHYGLEDGLSQQTIRCITKDNDGFLWLGTQDGLNRFDGNDFKIYQHNPKDSLSIAGNYINKVIENTDSSLWIATGSNGICYYQPWTDTFVRTSLNWGNYVSLGHDHKGNIFAGHPETGIYMLSKENGYTPTFFSTLGYYITSITVHGEKLLLGTKDGTLISCDVSNMNKLEKLSLNLPGSIEEIIPDGENLYLGTSQGLFQFNETIGRPVPMNIERYSKNPLEKLFIESISIENGKFYVGTDNGLFILEGLESNTGEFRKGYVYNGDTESENSITSNRVYDVLVQKELLFIGTNNLDVALITPPVFKNYNTELQPSLSNRYIFSLLKTKDYLFVGTRSGLNCIDEQQNIHIISKENTDQKLAYNVIRGMTLDNDNNLWLATTKGISVIDLTKFDPKKPKVQSTYFDEKNTQSLSNDKTRNVFKDSMGTIWVCTYGGGLNRFTGNLKAGNFTFERYMADPNTNSIGSDFIFSISQDHLNNYWITSTNGLTKLRFNGNDYQNPDFKVYKSDDKSGSLKNNTTLCTLIDSDNILWVATQSGLQKFNYDLETFTHFGKEKGLTNDYVYSILEDSEGFLWLSTNDGLFKFDKDSEEFTHYTIKDGLQSSEFNLGAHFNDLKNNTMYFGGINGFNAFAPNSVKKLDKEGSLRFTSLKIKEIEVNPLTHPNVLKTSFGKTKKIQLNHDDFPCYIRFSDFDFRPFKNNDYLYALDNGEWNHLNYSNELQLLKLPKGEHTLEVQGVSRNNIWQNKPLNIKITVIPPWYNSNFAYIIYALLFLTSAYFVYRFRLKQYMTVQEAKRLKELDMVKSKFITNITHEFRTPLTVILGYLNTISNKLGHKAEFKSPLSSIQHNSENLLNLVNEMLDLAKLETGNLKLELSNHDLVAFGRYMVHSFSSLAASKKLTLKFEKNEDFIYMDFDVEKMRQILSNLISNAIKFSESDSVVKLIIKKESNTAIIKVQDHGIGIPKEEQPFVFDRFYRSSKTSHQASGTGIGLALTKELVTLMQGEIKVESMENIGTIFTLHLPVTNALPKEKNTFTRALKETTINTESSVIGSAETKENTILIVEDNREVANYIGSCLHPFYKMLFAYNGKEGFELAKRTIPDVVLTDVMMPEMDGYELTKKLQNNIVTNHIPIIMLTAKSLDEDRLKGFRSGADAFLNKPFSEKELLLRINKLIEKRQLLQSQYHTTLSQKPKKKELEADKNLQFLNMVIDHVIKNMENTDYDGSKLASDLAMSESQLYRKLKAITNKSTAVYIRSIRLENAMELLRSTTKNISEVAFACGFNDPNWFSKAFKDSFGISPSEYRK